MEDVTFLIQGSLKEDTYKFYCHFYPEVRKIFSTWQDNTSLNNWKGEYSLHSKEDLLIENVFPNRIGFWERRMELELVSTLKGLDEVKTNYIVKLRGDEWYSNLNFVVESAKENDEKILITSAFMKKWDVWPFKINDHLMACKTSDLKIMFESSAINMIVGKELFESCWPLPYQSILALSYIQRKNTNSEDWKKYFKEAFKVIPLDILKFYKISSDDGKNTWFSNFEPNILSIEEM